MPASRRTFTHAARHCSSVPYSCSNSASVSPCMIARIDPIPCSPDSILHRFCGGRKGADWLISGQTNGMVERFNGRISAEVLAITLYSHDQLEQLLRGFNAAYNARRQRVLEGQTPDQVVAERLTAKPALANAKRSGRPGPDDIIKARLIAESAKEVSQPDSSLARSRFHSCQYAVDVLGKRCSTHASRTRGADM